MNKLKYKRHHSLMNKMSCSYELSLELKEKGFPQTAGFWYVLSTRGLNFHFHVTARQRKQMELAGLELVKSPTLSELIEACGESKFALWKGTTIWVATKQKDNGGGWYEDIGVDIDVYFQNATGTGSTPEEAVAHLWLSLQKKQ